LGTFNIGSGDTMQNIDIIEYIGKLCNQPAQFKYVEDRLGHDVRYTLGTHFQKPKITKSLFEFIKETL